MSNSTFWRHLMLALALVMGVAVLVLSILPVNRVTLGTRAGAGSSSALIERADFLHLGLHILTFGMLAAVTWFALHISVAGAVNKMIALSSIMLLGWGTEYLQHRLYDNRLEVGDVLTNILSATFVFVLLSLWARYRKPAPEPELEGEHVAYVLRDLD